jgi:bifunctional non-homologous end joining protein LigD
LDGEIVALDPEGRPSFGLLQQRMHVADAARARRLADQVPATYMVFDLLQFEGHPTVDLSYDERRQLLEGLGLQGASWATPPAFADVPGEDVQRVAAERALEGVVAKRRSSRYRAGRRSDDWVKVKNVRTQEVVIGGWSPGKGRRQDRLGALLLGVPEGPGLRYVGKVGTGFSDEALDDLRRRLDRRRRVRSPFVGAVPAAEAASATWVKPDLVGEVGFGEWTGDGRLRHPRWRGLRPDKAPDEVVIEP